LTMPSLEKRLSRLTGEAFQAAVEERVEEELFELFDLLQERLERETFLRVMQIAASGERSSGGQ
jgi:hypothetical protein